MKESHRKGVANHPDPDPCEGVATLHLKRWEGAYAGWVSRSSELRNRPIRVLTSSGRTESNTAVRVKASALATLGSRSTQACIETSRARTGEARLLSVGRMTRIAGRRR